MLLCSKALTLLCVSALAAQLSAYDLVYDHRAKPWKMVP